jgi:hypothetical protein
VQKADDHVRDLHASVVDVILDFDALPGAAQQADEGVAQRRIAQVADVRGLVGIDVGVLDDAFPRIGGCRRGRRSGLSEASREERRARQIKIHIPAAGDLDALDAFDGQKLRGNFLRDLPRRRLLRHDGYVLLVLRADVRRKRGADSGYENVYQVAPISEEKP